MSINSLIAFFLISRLLWVNLSSNLSLFSICFIFRWVFSSSILLFSLFSSMNFICWSNFESNINDELLLILIFILLFIILVLVLSVDKFLFLFRSFVKEKLRSFSSSFSSFEISIYFFLNDKL